MNRVPHNDPWYFNRWAFQQTTGNPARKSVLSMLAMMADCNTGRCEALQETLAIGTECSERAVRGHLKTLEDMGLIARRAQFRRDRGRRGDEFLLLAPGVTEWPDGEPVTPRQNLPVEQTSTGRMDTPPQVPEPAGQEQPPIEQPPSGSARASKSDEEGAPPTWTYGRKPVPQWAAARALAALAAFAERSGQRIAPFRPSNGKPSDALTLVTGAVLDHPDVDEQTWARLVKHVFKDPWWTGVPGAGVVFGPKVLDRQLQAITNPTAVAIGNGRRVVPRGEQLVETSHDPDVYKDLF